MAEDQDVENEEMEDLDALDEVIEDDTVETAAAAAVAIPGLRPELKKLYQQHPELIVDYIETILQKVPLKSVQPSGRDPTNINYDEHHKTYPFLTQYEKTKVLSHRASELAHNSRPFIEVPKHVTNVSDIARLELEAKRIPYIIKRPLPDRTFEYWRLQDLIIL